jgi:glycosyltransferase involved in cell wall biosynthesis
VASVSYWFLSPSLLLAVIGKLRGWDRIEPTPEKDWRSAVVDVGIPAKNEQATIAFCLSSVFQQDFPIRNVIVCDDASTDRTGEVVHRFRELSGRNVELITRKESMGKTPTVREQCRKTDADALVILDADTLLVTPNYISRIVEELYRNAGVASACGEVMPLTQSRQDRMFAGDSVLQDVLADDSVKPVRHNWLQRLLVQITVLYRSALYLLLQRVFYDGHLKLFGAQLNPVGCAVAYKTARLRECFAYAEPRVGDNLSNSEDIYIGHFFSWKGYRNIQVRGVRCESVEPPITRLPRQLYLWSSAFLQSMYYFKDLPLSPFKYLKALVTGKHCGSALHAPSGVERRRIREQYRAVWGEQFTCRYGRAIGCLELVSLIEKVSYPLILLFLVIFHPEVALLTVCLEALVCSALVCVTADRGSRLRFAGAMLVSTPVRLLSMGVDFVTLFGYLADMAAGNRKWKK